MAKPRTKLQKSPLINKHISEILSSNNTMMKLALIRNYQELILIMINSVLADEVTELTGKRYKHDKKKKQMYRWGTNPGSVVIGQEKVPIRVPRIRDEETKSEKTLDSYSYLKDQEIDEEQLLKAVLHGVSMNDYHSVVRHFEDSYGLSRSKVSERFIEESTKRVESFFNRDLSEHNFIAIFVDGKYLAKEQIVIVLGVTEQGDKIPLGFIQTTMENSASIKGLFSNIIERGFKYEEGIICIIDGSKGIKKAIVDTFGHHALIKRCAWHKRENMLSYLSDKDKEEFKKRYNKAYSISDYDEAKNAFEDLKDDLRKINISAVNSINDGLEELLTLHRLELIDDFGKSFSTTNAIESLNSQLMKYIGKVKRWTNSDQRFRWVASALIEIEPRLRKVSNYRNIETFIKIIRDDIKIKIQKSKEGISD
jgi:putative transposase